MVSAGTNSFTLGYFTCRYLLSPHTAHSTSTQPTTCMHECRAWVAAYFFAPLGDFDEGISVASSLL